MNSIQLLNYRCRKHSSYRISCHENANKQEHLQLIANKRFSGFDEEENDEWLRLYCGLWKGREGRSEQLTTSPAEQLLPFVVSGLLTTRATYTFMEGCSFP